MSFEIELRCENEKLRRRIKELESVIKKSSTTGSKKSKLRPIDFSRYKIRRIALKFCYLGWNYCGLQQQRSEDNTIIEKIFIALELCKLIENREDSNIVVCGRTDKGVSAFQQVLSINVRSNLSTCKGVLMNSGINISQRNNVTDEEIDYVFLLNKVLPKNIRMLAWSPVDIDFSARFNCLGRSYKYFFPRADLCIKSMNLAGQKLIGLHDFRNFCSMQISQGVTQFVRRIFNLSIDPVNEAEPESPHKMYVVNVSASSFIYHQIRCMVAVLLMIGQQKESVHIIDQLLDISGPGGLGKPFYNMSSDLPLVFYDCTFGEMEWHTSKEALNDFVGDIQQQWVEFQSKQTIIKLFLNEIHRNHEADVEAPSLIDAILNDMKTENWKPLLKRPKEKTLEEKIDLHSQKKLKMLQE